MGLQFLSDEWFTQLEMLKKEAGDIEIPAALQDLAINITVTGTEGGDTQLCLNAGLIEKNHYPDAPTTMILPIDLALRIFVENDQSAGMQGFMSGQIKIEGDMSRLMALQTVQPTADQQALQQKIQDITSAS